jgi:hypothetical protein
MGAFNIVFNIWNVKKLVGSVELDGWRYKIIFETHQITNWIANDSLRLFLSVVVTLAGPIQRRDGLSKAPNVIFD